MCVSFVCQLAAAIESEVLTNSTERVLVYHVDYNVVSTAERGTQFVSCYWPFYGITAFYAVGRGPELCDSLIDLALITYCNQIFKIYLLNISTVLQPKQLLCKFWMKRQLPQNSPNGSDVYFSYIPLCFSFGLIKH